MPHLPAFDIDCPYCGETITLVVDDSGGDQQYIEDCHVCCKPIEVRVRVDDDGTVEVDAWGQDDA
ncbi:CPXCG motif-containing cysteine-rich protein [Pseudoxanthomonas sp. LjRoot168]|uniref:CPXCG motif-containing cysteine-rich protein n=1 Tax=unclassified Pseudoxanthomonas TaxID=2645906 RepID=UPI003ED10F4C